MLITGTTSQFDRSARPARGRGFTMIEMMMVLVIVAIILAVVVPGFSTVMQRTRLKSYANEVVSSVYLARSEAIKRNTQIRVCSSTDGTACDGGGDWEQGWIVIDPNDVVINHQPAMKSGYLMFELSSSSFDELVFNSAGVADNVATFKICQDSPEDGIEEKRVAISLSGRPNVETITTGCP